MKKEMKNLDQLVENFFTLKENGADFEIICKLIEEQLDNPQDVALDKPKEQVIQEEQERFSITIPIPRLTPSEAYGDPDSQSREEIQKVFASISGGHSIPARIESINKFLDPTSAKRKRSPMVIINMMMIVEALQATLNDYNESASGFVFEGFMAVLTGGKQITGKVAGTLPIEDFVAFSQFGTGQPVSLKLLSGGTPVKGSFTNLVDFLLVRGASAIKYLVAYKLTVGESVEKINIFAFDITRENFIKFIKGSLGEGLLEPLGADAIEAGMQEFNTTGDLAPIANLFVQLNGYKRGLLYDYVETGKLPSEISPEEEEVAQAKAAARKGAEYLRTLKTSDPQKYAAEKAAEKERKKLAKTQALHESINRGELSLNEAFHYIEKQTMLTEAADDASQWSASLPQLESMGDINWEPYGELDLSQENISELSQIYSDIPWR